MKLAIIRIQLPLKCCHKFSYNHTPFHWYLATVLIHLHCIVVLVNHNGQSVNHVRVLLLAKTWQGVRGILYRILTAVRGQLVPSNLVAEAFSVELFSRAVSDFLDGAKMSR